MNATPGLVRGLGRRPAAVLSLAVAAAMGYSLWATRDQTFFSDEWRRFILAGDDSVRDYLLGTSGHLIVLHAALYRGLLGAFGADSYLPFRIVEAALIGANGVLFYMLASRRAGPWVAIAATIPLLALGAAVEVTATAYGIVVLLPMAFGLGALVSVTRLGWAGDPLTMILLVLAVASLSDGLAFIAGVGVALGLQSGRQALRRAWVVAIPVALYVVWYFWAHANGVPRVAHLTNLEQTPGAILSSAAAGIEAATGTFGSEFSNNGTQQLEAGFFLLALGLFFVILRWRDRDRPSPDIWIPLATALAFWLLLGLVVSSARPVYSSRYLFPDAVFVLLIAVECLRGVRVTRNGALILAGVATIAAVPNALALERNAGDLRDAAVRERAALGALELLARERPGAPLPGIHIENGVAGLSPNGDIPATDYLRSVERFGSPAGTPAEIAAQGGLAAMLADKVLVQNADLQVRRASPPSRSCPPAASAAVPLAGGRRLIVVPRPGTPPAVAVKRLGSFYTPVKLPAGAPAIEVISHASEAPDWSVAVGRARVCSPGG